MNSTGVQGSAPLISVVIPARNEEGSIAECIASIRNAGWPPEALEILVVDHQSTDATATAARAAGARVLSHSSGAIGSVRNTGLKAAKGDFVAYVDADCTVPSTWLLRAIELLQSDKSIGAVGGPCLSPTTGTWIERCLAPDRLRQRMSQEAKTLATSSLIARVSLLKEIGLFNELLLSGEDDDLSLRIRRRGFTLVSTSDCHIVHHGYPRTWWAVVEKEKWHGSNHIEVRSEFDLTLLLTELYLVALLGLPFVMVAAVWVTTRTVIYALLVDVALQFTPPLLFALKRLRFCPRDWPLSLHLIAVGYAYFLGHSLGLVSNYQRRLAVTLFRFRPSVGRRPQ